MAANDDDVPDLAELEVGRDHLRHRASRSWINEAFAMCAAAFALGTYGVVQSSLRTGYPSGPGVIASLVFGFAVIAVFASFRALGPQSTYPERRRRSIRMRLVFALIAAGTPLLVAIAALVLQIAWPAARG